MNPPRWIALIDEEPKEGQTVITWHEETGIDMMRYHVNSTEITPHKDLNGTVHLTADSDFGYAIFTNCRGFLTDDVTHWMPLSQGIQDALKKLKYA